ncbi:insecticidal delta-endotoxin Cry8Ea1 family protein [Bacillus thuringiensis]|nr:insecticidal delta-endotoxin Cry8Ea1 family protein [Bacillus thuringiensis]OTY10661.1 pesticidal protein [Bacillus thuringiensis serovar kim]
MDVNKFYGSRNVNRMLNNPFNNSTQKELLPVVTQNPCVDNPFVNKINQTEMLTNTSIALNTVAGVTGAVLGSLGVPGASLITSFYQKVLGLLWPTNSRAEIWDSFISVVEDLIKKEVENYAREKAITELEGLGDNMKDYKSKLQQWLDTPNDDTKRSLKHYMESLDMDFKEHMPQFRIKGYEVQLLPVFAHAANLHLSLFRDMVLYGPDLGFTPEDLSEDYQQLQQRIIDYTNHCNLYFEQGLSSLKKSSYEEWVIYNRFRREMTLMVLDIIAQFPYYDVKKYPKPVSTQLTREVYTDPLITSFFQPGQGPNFSFMESNAIRNPHLVTYLDSLYIYTAKFRAYSQEIQPDLYFWTAHKGKYKLSASTDVHDTALYGSTSGSISEKNYSFNGNNIYQTLAAPSAVFTTSKQYYGIEQVEFYGDKGKIHYYGDRKYPLSVDSANQLPPDEEPISENYDHILTHASAVNVLDGGTVPIFAWTHRSADYYNTIYSDKITQIPAVKINKLENPSTVVKGPGFTGGDLVKRGSTGILGYLNVTVNSPLSQRYAVKIRYASTISGDFHVQIDGVATLEGHCESTINSGDELSFESFSYKEFSTTVQFTGNKPRLRLSLDKVAGTGVFYFDKIEFIPVDVNYDERVQLEKAQKSVNALFTAGRHALQTDVTDFKVDQVSILVDCVSGELYPNEKRELLSLVKYAKRLSYSRNLLLDPTFDSINSSEENGWHGSNGIVIGNGNFVFKGNYLIFSGTNDTQYPTYLYQKIDESKLKEYTRYKLRGFIENSQDLEAYVVRYDAKHETLDVSDNLYPDISPVNACGEPNRCAALPYLDENPRLECSSIQDGILSDSHSFSLNIDTGSIDSNENVGIWVLFKISTPEGYAKFGNLEVIEDGPVIGEALARVKRQETKWRNKLAQLRTETQAIYTRAKQAIDNLFTNAQDSHLKIGATFASIVAARKIVQSIREAYMSWLSIVPGVNYPIFTELNERVQQAFQLYDVRNVVRNGRFLNGVSDWIVTSDVKVQEENGNNVLVLSNWDAQVLQCLKLYQDRGYILRVTARKEGLGEGYITITDEAGHTDQLTFGTCEEIDASNTFVSTGYMTKELEFFPDTEKVRIEIGETEGIFQVESVELFLMEDLC